jgi:cellulose synthase/poly-beta-1,6-N-acetylglucosamine synthase-like glycosyltransferase
LNASIINIICGIFALSFLIQLYFYLFVFKNLAFYSPKQKYSLPLPVSVIVCARNEAKNLESNLPFILEQDYPNFEVVVVNDASTDSSHEVLAKHQKKFKNLQVINLNKSQGKKNALTEGIKASTYEYLLMTDADCKPNSNDWIKNMAQNFYNEKEVVLGYGAYQYQKGFLNQLIRFDTAYIAIQYLSFALNGMTYMGVGRNLAYKKSLFIKNMGFENHKDILSGDDDLFINEVATETNTAIEISPNAQTVSGPKTDWNAWLYQKKRHLTTGNKYKFSNKLYLGLFQASMIAFYLSFAYLMLSGMLFWPIFILFLTRFSVQVYIFTACFKKLNEKQYLLLFPLYELIILILNLFLVISNSIYKSNTWQKN